MSNTSATERFGRDAGQQGVTIQCRHDKQEMLTRLKCAERERDNYFFHPSTATTEAAINRIDRGDLVFTVGPNRQRGNVLNNAIPVVSNLNGLAIKKTSSEMRTELSGPALYDRLSEGIRYLGVSLGATVPNPEFEGDAKEQITVRVHGTADVFNNSDYTFAPGDTVLWTLSTEDDFKRRSAGIGRAMAPRYGRSVHKYTLKVVPLKHYSTEHYVGTTKSMFLSDKKEDTTELMQSHTARFALLLKRFVARIWWQSLRSVAGAHSGVERPHEGCIKFADRVLYDDFADQWEYIEKREENNELRGEHFQTFAREFIEAGAENDLTELFALFLKLQCDIRNRTIGKMFGTSAGPGQNLSVLLGVN